MPLRYLIKKKEGGDKGQNSFDEVYFAERKQISYW